MTDKKTSKEIDCEYTREITCPYCGYKDRDSWESPLNDGESDVVECGECGEDFTVYADVARTFISKKKENR